MNKSENATLQYFIFCEKVLDKKCLLKLLKYFTDIQQKIRRNSTNVSLLMSELCSFLCFKLYSLKFAIAHGQRKIVMLIRIGHTFVAFLKNTRHLTYHLKQAQESILNLSNL